MFKLNEKTFYNPAVKIFLSFLSYFEQFNSLLSCYFILLGTYFYHQDYASKNIFAT